MKIEVDFQDTNKPTDKQISYIDAICETLDIVFEGTTRKEASDFIDQYADAHWEKKSYEERRYDW
jgi:hypothetical protein